MKACQSYEEQSERERKREKEKRSKGCDCRKRMRKWKRKSETEIQEGISWSEGWMRRKRVPSFLYIFSCILQRSLGKVCCLKQRSASLRPLIMPSFGLTSSSVGMALSLSLSLSISLSPLSSLYLTSPYILSLLLLYRCALCPFSPVRSCYVAFLEPTSKLPGEKKEGCRLGSSGVGSLQPLIPVP